MSDLVNNTIEDIIRSHIIFKQDASNGWNRVYCEVCGDGSRTKGPRGGWLFSENLAFYHCFNCGIDGNFDPTREHPWSKEMYRIFDSFNIPKDVIGKLVYQKKSNNPNTHSIPKRVVSTIKPIEIPEHFYKLSEADADNPMAIKARDYLESRFVDPDSHPFYLSTGISHSQNPKDISFAKVLHNRIIIPSVRNKEVVYYIARSLDEASTRPYINAPVPKSGIIYGFDKLYTNPKNYLFVVEGFFDAYHLKGVAVLENHMTKDQIDILEKSPRIKVVVPDRKGDSRKLAEQGVALGWGISFPELGDCKDVCAGIGRYGKLYTLAAIMRNIKFDKQAEFNLNLL